MSSNAPGSHRQPTGRLNFDVLRLICNHLTKVSDVLSFALTCSTLRKGALQRRLSMSPVALSSLDSVEKFHKFIFAAPTSHAPHLYGLSVSPDFYYAEHEDQSCTKHLAAILDAATHLEYLSVPTSIGLSVCATIAKMTSIRELAVFSDSGGHIQHEPGALNNLLAELRSPLQHLSIADHKMGKMSAGFLHDHLFHLAPTLESLTLGDSDFRCNIPPSLVTTPFTALRLLEISAIYQFDFYHMDVLLRLFPNLDDTLLLNGFMSPPEDQYLAHREQNNEAQQDYTWPGLDRVTLSVTLAFMLALRCPIRYMCIDGPVLYEMHYLPYALRDNCPQQLLLPITLFARNHLQYLDGLFPPEAAETLTHLVLFVEIEVNQVTRQWNFSWDQFMACLIGSMTHLRLTYLRIVLHYNIHPPVSVQTGEPPCVTPDSEPYDDNDFARNVAHDADLYPAAVRLLDTMQTLEYVFLTTCGVRRYGEPWKCWHSSKAWCVVVDADEDAVTPLGGPPDAEPRLSCAEICGEEAQAVIYEEELNLRYREQNMIRHCVKNASN